MGVLHVEDGVLVDLAGDQVHVERLGGVHRQQQVREPGRVGAHLVDHIGQLDHLAGPLREPDLPAVPLQVHKLGDDDLQVLPVVAEHRHGGVHADHVAVVVRPEDVHQPVGPRELVPVVRHVGHQVGGLPVALDQHPVLVVAMVGAAQPDSAALLVDGTGGPKVGQRGVHGPRGDHRPFREPGVEVDGQ